MTYIFILGETKSAQKKVFSIFLKPIQNKILLYVFLPDSDTRYPDIFTNAFFISQISGWQHMQTRNKQGGFRTHPSVIYILTKK